MREFHTQTAVRGIAAPAVLEALLAHLTEHEFIATRGEEGWVLDYESARIVFTAHHDCLGARITAPTQEALFDARMMAHYHLAEYAACDPADIEWEGDQPAFIRPPAFRVLTVLHVEDLSPHLRRVRFQGNDLGRYERADDLHCKLLLPQPGVVEPEWPILGDDGMPRFPEGEKRLDMRTYTIRRLDTVAGWIDIDFVLHDDAGPGSRWAARARPGDQIGVSGPGGRTARPAAWMMLAADDTGLPAIARITEQLPPQTQGEVIIEIQSAADQIPLNIPAGMRLRWLHREHRRPGVSTLLQEAIQACDIPAAGDRFVWVAAEFSTAQTVRAWLRDGLGFSGKDQLVVAYWRHGMDEATMKSGGRRVAPVSESPKAAE